MGKISSQSDNGKKINKRSGNEARRVRWTKTFLEIIILFASGMLLSATMPPLNWNAAAWIVLIPLFLICLNKSFIKAALCGFIWGVGWIFTGFYWLREIDPVIPYLIAPVLALFPALWASLIPVIRRAVLIPTKVTLEGYTAENSFMQKSVFKNFFFAAVLAAWWCVTEWLRSRLLPWNYLAVSQWQNVSLLQICAFTGTYGVSFLIVLTNITLAVAFKDRIKGIKQQAKFSMAFPFFISLFLIMLVVSIGAYSYRQSRKGRAMLEFKAGLVQGNISQRRVATREEALEAMNIYLELSYLLASRKPEPDIIIWPETATPFPYRGDSLLCMDYQRRLYNLIQTTKKPMVIGSVDFEDLPPDAKRYPGTTNSALLLNSDGRMVGKYDKIHRVPFGEYVPFRKYLPEWIIKRIDMKRDLVPGKDFTPLNILPGIKAGISICFEDIFEYISRREALEGANLLLVITNDAWYPTSSEPDQHLANCVFRTIETGLPMIRCGNNSASCLIEPNGVISDCLFKKERNGKLVTAPEVRDRRAGVIKVQVPLKPRLTFYARYGNIFVGLCWLIVLGAVVISALKWRDRKQTLAGKFKKNRTDNEV
jgi:apolipoprotein N-acyltransferase